MLTDKAFVRPDIRRALDEYARGTMVEVGGFLEAVLSNDLREAFGRADSYNFNTLGAIVAYCYNEIPGVCWGSPEKVAAWQDAWRARHREKSSDVENPPGG